VRYSHFLAYSEKAVKTAIEYCQKVSEFNVSRDVDKALRNYKLATDGSFKHGAAAFKYAELLWKGEEVDRDVKEAARYFCQAGSSKEVRPGDVDRPPLTSKQRSLARDLCKKWGRRSRSHKGMKSERR
jgi:hypothetical protein